MATLTIRRLDDEVYQRLRERARSNGRSLEAEVRHILAEEARTASALVEEMTEFHEQMIQRHGILPDSTPLLREMRDSE